jgi:hypothetical protein
VKESYFVSDSDAIIAFPTPARVMVGEVEKVIPKFKLGKTLLVLERLTKLLEQDAVSATLRSGKDLPNTLIEQLPTLLRTARPAVFELLALILIPSKELRDLEEAGKLDERLKKEAEDLYDDADLDTAFALLEAGIDQMGVDSLRKNVTRLIQKFSKAKN